MSRVKLSLDAQVRTLVAAIEELGGKVTWRREPPQQKATVEIVGTADADEVYARLPEHCHDFGSPWTQPDREDLRDFIGACARGDRLIAAALLSRLNLDDRNAAAGEQALFAPGGRA